MYSSGCNFSYGFGVSAWCKCWNYTCIIPLIIRSMIFPMCRGKSEGAVRMSVWRGQGEKSGRDWCQNVCFTSQNGPSLRRKRVFQLWGNMRDTDVFWNLLTYARKNKLKCAMSNQSLSVGEHSLLLCEHSTWQTPSLVLCIPFCIARGREQSSFRASSLHKRVPISWYIYISCRLLCHRTIDIYCLAK